MTLRRRVEALEAPLRMGCADCELEALNRRVENLPDLGEWVCRHAGLPTPEEQLRQLNATVKERRNEGR